MELPLQAHYRDYDKMTYARSVLVIHNIAHQGRGPLAELGALEVPDNYGHMFQLYDPIGGEHMNIFKAGISAAHRLVAVSHGWVPMMSRRVLCTSSRVVPCRTQTWGPPLWKVSGLRHVQPPRQRSHCRRVCS